MTGLDLSLTPPHSTEAEQAVLGALLINSERLPLVKEILTPDDFFRHDHRIIFEAICKTKNPDYVTVGQAIENDGLLDDIGGIGYLIGLYTETPGASNVLAYARTVKDTSDQRRCLQLGHQIAALEGSGKDRSRQACELVREFANNADRDSLGLRPLKSWGPRLIDMMTELEESETGMIGTPTYYPDLDRILGGLRGGDLTLVAARPAMGKTALALCMALQQARKAHDVALFELEMSGEQLMQRATQVVGHIPGDYFKGLMKDHPEKEHMDRQCYVAMGEIKELPLYVDDRAAVTVSDIHARLARLKASGSNPKTVYIDYLQLIRSEKRSNNRNNEVEEISRNLKALAKETDTHVVALSQLNRGLESRPDKRPLMADLRDSGALEQDADNIIMLYRDEVYHPDGEENGGVVEAIIRKQRNGKVGTTLLTYLAEQTRYESFPKGHVYRAHDPKEKKSTVTYKDFG